MTRKTLKRGGPPLFPEHPAEEHEWRLQRARKTMSEDGLDALLLARNINVFYMSGSRFVFVGMDAPVALAPQSSVIVTQDADVYCQRFGPFDSDEVPEHTASCESLELYDDEAELPGILSDYGIGKGARIGTEWGAGTVHGINPLKFLDIEKQISTDLGAEIVDATTTINKVRSVKSALEIERMKKSVQAAASAMTRAYEVIEVGMTEVALSQMVGRFMMEAGADDLSHAQVMAEGDGKYRFLSSDALDRAIEPGWVHLDIGAKYRRYMSDINRGIFLGRGPTSDEEDLYACRLAVSELLDERIRPGVSIDSVIAAVRDLVEGRGYVLRDIGGAAFVGHSIGLEPYQKPNLIPSALQSEFAGGTGEVLFEEGMMFTYEMVVDTPGPETLPFFNVEDNVVVTADGVETMNADLSRELQVKT